MKFTSVDLQWSKALDAGMTQLVNHCPDPMKTNKVNIVKYARDSLVARGCKVQGVGVVLDDSRPFSLAGYIFQAANYFGDRFPADNPDHHAVVPGRYSYQPTRGVTSFWVDFADVYLGGGIFGMGFLEEEVMCCEMPELANVAGLRWAGGVLGFFTREPHDQPNVYDPGKGLPTPFVLRDAWRTLAVPPGTDADIATKMIDTKYIEKWTLDKPYPVNVLAMAAPRLASTKLDDQIAQTVVDDLFNTFVAGFSLAREAAGPRHALVNSGPIGTGKFNNNACLVYILQVLAARHTGVDLTLFSYNQDRQAYSDKIMQQLHYLDKDISDVLGQVRRLMALYPPPA